MINDASASAASADVKGNADAEPKDNSSELSRSDSKAAVLPLMRDDSKAELDYLDNTSSTSTSISTSNFSEEQLAANDKKTLIEFREILELERIKMREIFKKFDKTGNKTISSQELRQGLNELGINLTDIEAERLTKRFDIEGDNKLHYYEFVKIFHGLPAVSY